MTNFAEIASDKMQEMKERYREAIEITHEKISDVGSGFKDGWKGCSDQIQEKGKSMIEEFSITMNNGYENIST